MRRLILYIRSTPVRSVVPSDFGGLKAQCVTMQKPTFLLVALSLVGAALCQAQNPNAGAPGSGQGRRGPGGRHMGPPPVIAALDANHDHVISADELANAPAALKTLDRNGDGQLSLDELRPARPENAPPPPADAGPRHHAMPLMLALDADGDGALSAAEIANATTSLKALDANQDGQLTPDEFAPLPPAGAPHRGPGRRP